MFRQALQRLNKTATWRSFTLLFVGLLAGICCALYLFILLVDPYDIIPFSLPIDRRIVSISDRFMYPQIVRSKRFDSLVIGTSTSRLLDPEQLDRLFHARFANLGLSGAVAWEEWALLDLFLREVGPPKVLLVGLDAVWCDPDADHHRITFRGFPYWLYDDNRWNDYIYLFNYGTLEIAARLVGYHLGLYPERIRYDGYEVFVPPESQYDLKRAHDTIWKAAVPPPTVPEIPMTPAERAQLSFPALAWLENALSRMPPSTLKILAYMPVHVAAQPGAGTRAAAIEAECKSRVADLARKFGAKVVDWRISSSFTRNDANYWDAAHYRLPLAAHIAEDTAAAVLQGKRSSNDEYVIVVP